ncbi:MAG: rhomboid family intramembrane serine protease [Verrucomicrobiota bacterium]
MLPRVEIKPAIAHDGDMTREADNDPSPPLSTPDGAADIPVKSRAQAMDWSLVLASQGMIHSIEQSGDRWVLRVDTKDRGPALRLLRQYHLENRRWPWQQQLPLHSKVVFDWAALAWSALMLAFFLAGEGGRDLRSAGILDGALVSHGERWRLFTAMSLHADAGHLMANAIFGFIFLGLAMGLFGTGIAVLGSFLCGAAANLFTWWMDPGHHSLGASGMVMAAAGMLVGHAVVGGRVRERSGWVTPLVGGGMIFLYLGSGAGTDLAAHLGGFVCGLVLGLILGLFPVLAGSGTVNVFAGIIYGGLVAWSWWVALNAPS